MVGPVQAVQQVMVPGASHGLWATAMRQLARDRLGLACALVVLGYLALLLCSSAGLVARHWDAEVAASFAPPDWFMGQSGTDMPGRTAGQPTELGVDTAADTAPDDHGVSDPLAHDLAQIRQAMAQEGQLTGQALRTSLPLGADRWGRDVLQKTIKGAQTSVLVGLLGALLAVVIGTVAGALAGYFGGWVDAVLDWCYNVFTAIPYLLLVLALAAVLGQRGLLSLILILGGTGWTGTYRLVRAEYLRHRAREYVLAAAAIGASHWRRLALHIFPNTSHVALVQLSVLTVSFIKSEVILSFLGFGVPVGEVSWGSMLNEAQNELILGKWWQMAAASVAMAVLVTAFSLMTDALRDALDPKLRSQP